MAILFGPLFSSISKLLLSRVTRRPPQARPEPATYFDPSPFSSALDSTLRTVVALFAKARFLS
eukprot:5080824-Pleurochrysis_carterae.AAC.1